MKKHNRVSKKVLFTRILAGIMCALMLAGTLLAVIPFMGDHSDHDHASSGYSVTENT